MSFQTHFFCIAGLACTIGCGAKPSATIVAGGGDHTVTAHNEFDEPDPPAPTLPPPVVRRVCRTYADLKGRGIIAADKWRYGEQLPQGGYARLKLEDEADAGVVDGYANFAMVPIGDGGSEPSRFYVTHEGGVAGWQFLQGPFRLNK